MKRIGPLWLAMLVSCDSQEQLEQEPEILDASLDCLAGEADVTVIVGDDVVDVTAVYEDSTWFAVEQSSNMWEAEEAADCDGTWEIELTVVNAFGRTSSTTLYWPQVEPDSDGVEPPYGTTAGGQEVFIAGDDLELADVVLFGSEQATILSATEEGLVVQTPAHDAGIVDVSVEATGNVSVLEEAFTYWADNSGLYAGVALPSVDVYDTTWFTIGSAYAQLDPYGPYAQFEFLVHSPVPAENTYLGNMPAVGECDWGSTMSWEQFSLGSYVSMESDAFGAQVMLGNDDDSPVYYMVESDIDVTEWAGELFDVTWHEGNEHMPAMSVPELLMVPELVEDANFDWQAANPLTWGEDIEWTWTPGSHSGLLATIYPSSGSASLSVIQCASDPSGGSLSMAWDDLVADVDPEQVDGVHVLFTFYADVETVLPHDNSIFWSRGRLSYWVYIPFEAAR